VFNGKLIVHADAQGTDAQQSNRNCCCLTAPKSIPKPQLNLRRRRQVAVIGATVGQLDAEQIGYLRSRGLDEASAAPRCCVCLRPKMSRLRVSCAPLKADWSNVGAELPRKCAIR